MLVITALETVSVSDRSDDWRRQYALAIEDGQSRQEAITTASRKVAR